MIYDNRQRPEVEDSSAVFDLGVCLPGRQGSIRVAFAAGGNLKLLRAIIIRSTAILSF
jgi:hypothetical protein